MDLINTDTTAHITALLRQQRLCDRFGFTAERAGLIAALAFGEAA